MRPFDSPPFNPSIFDRLLSEHGPIHLGYGCQPDKVLAANAVDTLRAIEEEARRLTAETN
jgi:hypothetical protein